GRGGPDGGQGQGESPEAELAHLHRRPAQAARHGQQPAGAQGTGQGALLPRRVHERFGQDERVAAQERAGAHCGQRRQRAEGTARLNGHPCAARRHASAPLRGLKSRPGAARRRFPTDPIRHRMIRVHHLNHSRSQRVLWLLEELGAPYEIVRYERDRKTMLAPPELKKVHPLGKSPVVVDGPLVLAESGAIIETLVERHGPQLRPDPGTPEFLRYRYWLHYAEGSLMPPLLLKLVFDEIEKK